MSNLYIDIKNDGSNIDWNLKNIKEADPELWDRLTGASDVVSSNLGQLIERARRDEKQIIDLAISLLKLIERVR